MLVLRDSARPSNDSGDSMVLLKIWLTATGIYIWEFVTGLHYEWDVFRRRRTYLWTIWVYLFARWSTMTVAILALIRLNFTSQVNCQVMAWVNWSFANLSLSSGSLLLVLRIFAIWNRNKRITAIIATIWVINVSLIVLNVVQIRSVWDPAVKSCIILNAGICKIPMVYFLVADTTLLLIMLTGLLRLRSGGGGSFELWRFLWKQGVMWFVIAAVAELPPAVLMILNVNDALDLMFLYPSLVITAIATTRMYRSLQCFAHPFDTAPSNDDQKTRNSHLVSKTENPSIIRIHSDRLEVAVNTVHEEYSMSPVNHCDPYADKPHELGASIDDKVTK